MHDALTVYDQGLVGVVDENIAQVCQTEGRIIVTLDLGFSDIRAYPPEKYPGIIVMRLKQQDKPYVLEITSRWIKALSVETIEHRLWIVDDQKIRIREWAYRVYKRNDLPPFFDIPKTIYNVVENHPSGLHKSIANCWPDKFKATSL